MAAATPRQNYAGAGLAAFSHSTMKLPQNFNNLFFNGGLYSGLQPVFAHITASLIAVKAAAAYDDGSGGAWRRSPRLRCSTCRRRRK